MKPKDRLGRPYKHLKVEPITFTKLNEETRQRVDRISEEFKNGFTLISGSKLSVTFWGSARTKPSDPDYKKAYSLAKKFASIGYTVVTGGGPGIMAAGNCGAYDEKGRSIGLTIELPMEQKTNLCLTHYMDFKYFFTRKVCLAFASEAYVFFPGGFGTMDEFFEILTLVQTGKISPKPTIVLVGKKYWNGLDKFIKNHLLKGGKISPEDIDLYTITDDEDEIIDLVSKAPVRKNT